MIYLRRYIIDVILYIHLCTFTKIVKLFFEIDYMQTKLDKVKLEHNSYISLHVQLHNQLRQHIVSGRWRYGERIPTETQWSKHLDISRTTVRIALQRAEVEGLIKRTAGRGTFVTYEPQDSTNSRLIGYVTRSFHNEIHSVMLSSVETELRSAGYRVIFCNASDNDEETTILKQLREDNVAGILLWPNAKPTEAQRNLLLEYQNANIPIVFIDRLIEGVDADYVASDNFGGTYALTQHLIELGHQHIVHLMPNISNLLPVEDRQRGYETALKEHGLPVYEPWRLNSADEDEFHETDIYPLILADDSHLMIQIQTLMDQMNPKPTAVVCINDILAIITSRALRNMGCRVPEDVSVGGFDDISLAAYMDIPLTTVTQNVYEIGRVAAQFLLERLEGNTAPPKHYSVPTRLQIRMSTSTAILESQ